MSQQSRPPTRESRRVRGLSPTNLPSPPSHSYSISSINLQSTIFPGIHSTPFNPLSPNPSRINSNTNPSSLNHYYSTPSTPHPLPHHQSSFTPPHVNDASSSQYNPALHPPYPLNPYNINTFLRTPP